jgi:hypothetical protein
VSPFGICGLSAHLGVLWACSKFAACLALAYSQAASILFQHAGTPWLSCQALICLHGSQSGPSLVLFQLTSRSCCLTWLNVTPLQALYSTQTICLDLDRPLYYLSTILLAYLPSLSGETSLHPHSQPLRMPTPFGWDDVRLTFCPKCSILNFARSLNWTSFVLGHPWALLW